MAGRRLALHVAPPERTSRGRRSDHPSPGPLLTALAGAAASCRSSRRGRSLRARPAGGSRSATAAGVPGNGAVTDIPRNAPSQQAFSPVTHPVPSAPSRGYAPAFLLICPHILACPAVNRCSGPEDRIPPPAWRRGRGLASFLSPDQPPYTGLAASRSCPGLPIGQ